MDELEITTIDDSHIGPAWRVGTWKQAYAIFAIDRRPEAEAYLASLEAVAGTGIALSRWVLEKTPD